MHEQVEPAAEGLAHLAEDALEVLVGADVARRHERRAHRLRELADVLLDPLALVGERELRALVGEPLRDRPGDRALVGDAEHEPALAFETVPRRRVLKRETLGYPVGALRRFVLLAPLAALVLATAAAAATEPADPPPIGETTVPAVRAGTLGIPRGARRGRITRDRRAGGCRRSRSAYGTALCRRSARAKLDVAARARRAPTSRGSRARRRRRRADPRAIPEAQDLAPLPGRPRRASPSSLPTTRAAAAAALGFGAQGLPERPLPPRTRTRARR